MDLSPYGIVRKGDIHCIRHVTDPKGHCQQPGLQTIYDLLLKTALEVKLGGSMLLEGKIAIITGAAQGIGEVIARIFCEQGATAVLGDVNSQKLEASVRKINRLTGRDNMGIPVDVTQKKQVDDFVLEAVQRHNRIDILVNNAGILRHAFITEMEERDWDQVFAINVKGTFLFTQAIAKIMIGQRSGRIINISSCSGKKADLRQSAYNSSKAAVIGLTRVAALELGPYGIRCNAICPGVIDTEMVRNTFLNSPEMEKECIEKTALKRLGKPEDVAKVAVFLASELADHITGEALIVSAGELMGQ